MLAAYYVKNTFQVVNLMFIWNLDGLVRFCKVGLVLKHYILAQSIVCIMQFNSFVSGMLQLLCVD